VFFSLEMGRDIRKDIPDSSGIGQRSDGLYRVPFGIPGLQRTFLGSLSYNLPSFLSGISQLKSHTPRASNKDGTSVIY
jgi:hypothetical protein